MGTISNLAWTEYKRLTIQCAQVALRSLRLAIYPPVCQLCDNPTTNLQPVCNDCFASFRFIDNPCNRCGAPRHPSQVTKPGQRHSCMHCRRGKWLADSIFCLAVYQQRMQDAIIDMKQPRSDSMCRFFGKQLAQRANDRLELQDVHGVISVPHHWRKRISKRHNSSELIAQAVAEELRLPLYHRALVRVRQGEKQGTLHRAERERNIDGAFKVHDRFHPKTGKHWIVVDDIITSGATATTISRTLKKAGAKKITFLAVARGLNAAGVGSKIS